MTPTAISDGVRSEYKVTLIKNGVKVYLDIYMTYDQYVDLNRPIGRKITISYQWIDVKRIFVGWHYGFEPLPHIGG